MEGETGRGRHVGGDEQGAMGRGKGEKGGDGEVGVGRGRLWEGQRRGEKGQEEGGIHRWI